MFASWKDQVYNTIGSILFNNPHRVTHLLVRDEDGTLRDRTTVPASVRRLVETPVPPERNCLRTIQWIHHVVIAPGGRHVQELHIHPDAEELFIILRGTGQMTVGDETRPVAAGEVIYVPPDAEHCLENNSDELMRAYYVNIPTGTAVEALLQADAREGKEG